MVSENRRQNHERNGEEGHARSIARRGTDPRHGDLRARFDILETDDELTLYGDLPGAGPEDLDIRFENDHLLVHAKVPPRHDGREPIYCEYGVGDYYREFRISEAVDAAKISAEMKNGVLTLHLPKSESVKPRRIEVTAE